MKTMKKFQLLVGKYVFQIGLMKKSIGPLIKTATKLKLVIGIISPL
jgi:hypothetical protein